LMSHVGQADNGHDMRNALVNRIVIGAVKRHSGFMKCVGNRQDIRDNRHRAATCSAMPPQSGS
jgi:hypothetical protein